MDNRHRLSNLIMDLHNTRHQKLRNDLKYDHRFEDPCQIEPVRVVFRATNGVQRQYQILWNSVHVEYFFTKVNINQYDYLVDALQPNADHLFKHGIYGNGPNNGKTRAIKLTFDQGANDFETQGDEIAKQVVENMITMMRYLEPNLPIPNPLGLNFP